MNEELAAVFAEADAWVMSPLLFKALRGLVEERIASELSFKDLLAFQHHGVNVRVDDFLPGNAMALLRGMKVIGMIKFELGNLTFIKFEEQEAEFFGGQAVRLGADNASGEAGPGEEEPK